MVLRMSHLLMHIRTLFIFSTLHLQALAVMPSPRLEAVGPPIAVPLGATATLTCQSEGNPQPVVIGWLKNGTQIHSGKRFRIVKATYYQLLEIWSITSEDKGVYQCKAMVGKRSMTANVTVTIVVPPTLHNVSESVTTTAGSDLTLHCFGSDLLFIRWSCNNSYIDYLPRYRVTQLGYELVIPNVTKSDSGQYQCEAFNERFQVVDTIEVTVQYAPEIYLEPQNTITPIGHFVAFVCDSNAEPAASTRWRHDGQLVVDDGRIHVDSTTNQLEIRGVKYSDRGNYQCEKTNILGTTTSRSAKLQVININVEASTPTLVPVVYGHSIRLTCGTSTPSVPIQWTQNGAVITGDDETLTGQLNLQMTTYQSELDLYSCVYFKDKENVYIQNFRLSVQEAPEAVTSIQIVSLDQETVEGTINCKVFWTRGKITDTNNSVVSYAIKVFSANTTELIQSTTAPAQDNSSAIDGLLVNVSYYIVVETVTIKMTYPSRPKRFILQANSDAEMTSFTPGDANNSSVENYVDNDSGHNGNIEHDKKDSSNLGTRLRAAIAVSIVTVVLNIAIIVGAMLVVRRRNRQRSVHLIQDNN